MIKTLMDTDLHLTNMQSKYVGKVREVYHIKDDILIMFLAFKLAYSSVSPVFYLSYLTKASLF